jgi:hypothetical protein
MGAYPIYVRDKEGSGGVLGNQRVESGSTYGELEDRKGRPTEGGRHNGLVGCRAGSWLDGGPRAGKA